MFTVGQTHTHPHMHFDLSAWMQLATVDTGAVEMWLFAVPPGIPQQLPALCQGDPALASAHVAPARAWVHLQASASDTAMALG